jgi:GR25 family glycosyltransferase involved in LPS biosynthesis
MEPAPEIKQSDAQIDGSIGVYVINLERSKERRKHILDQVEKLNMPYDIVLAVDGEALSKEEIDKAVDLEVYKKFARYYRSIGEIGCALSHFKVLRKFLESNYQYALVLEDDISFDPDLLRKIAYKSLDAHYLWNILTFEVRHRGMPVKVKNILSNYYLSYYLTDVHDAGAYLIDRSTAVKLLEYSLPIKTSVDYFFTRAWELDIKFAGIEPRIVHQTFGDSEILQKVDKKGLHKRNRSVDYAIFIAKTETIRFLYNLKLAISAKLKL